MNVRKSLRNISLSILSTGLAIGVVACHKGDSPGPVKYAKTSPSLPNAGEAPEGGSIAGPSNNGGADGGGGFRYPNSRLLLRIVSQQLAKQVLKMDDQAFAQFPPQFRRVQLAAVIRDVVEASNQNHPPRANDSGKMEALIFDYDKDQCESGHCGRILALQPFFDAYNGQPVEQIQREKRKPELYLLIVKELRRRLLHEAMHLAKIGTVQGQNWKADLAADRIETAMASQYAVCVSPDWTNKLDAQGVSRPWFQAVVMSLQDGTAVFPATWDYSSWAKGLPNSAEIKEGLLREVETLTTQPLVDGRYKPAEGVGRTTEVPEIYTNFDGQKLYWQKYDVDCPRNATTLAVNLQTGEGKLGLPNLLKCLKEKKIERDESTLQCRIKSPVIDLTNFGASPEENSRSDFDHQGKWR